MNVLILDACPAAPGPLSTACDTAAAMLTRAGAHVERMVLRDMNIVNCCGKFDCWLKSPGQCATRDDAGRIGRVMMPADMLVLVTPISFGGYGSLAKSAMDRCLPALLPFLEVVYGEVHHPLRGKRVKRLAVIGGMTEPDARTETILRDVAGRNALNLRSPAHGVAFVYDDDDERAAARAARMALSAAGVPDEGGAA